MSATPNDSTVRGFSHFRLPAELQNSIDFFRQLLNSAPDPMLVIDEPGEILIANAQCQALLGYSARELVGKTVEILIPESLRHHHVELRQYYRDNPMPRPMGSGRELQVLRKDGSVIDVEISLGSIEANDRLLVTAALRDVSERKKIQQEINYLASYPRLSPIPIVEMGNFGEIIYLNPVAEAAFPELVTDNTHSHPVTAGIVELFPHLRNGSAAVTRNIIVGEKAFEQQLVYIPDTDRVRVYSWDVTRLKAITEKLVYQSHHDVLTGLVNRQHFHARLDQAVAVAQNNGVTSSLGYIDLDQFKVINDTCGHKAGDVLLKLLASELKTKLRTNDVLARLGGDEFGFLLDSCPVSVARDVANKLRKTVEDFRFTWEQKVFGLGASIGLVEIKPDSSSSASLLSAVDAACYMAKEKGRNQVYVHEDSDTTLQSRTREMNWTRKIRSAIEENRWELYFQKIVSIDRSRTNYEVLLRMRNRAGELVLPGQFVPAAERYGMMMNLDSWVVQNTVEAIQLGRFGSQGHVSINLSGQTLANSRVMQEIVRKIDELDEPSRICLEITETAMISNMSLAEQFIKALRERGCKFALDDFGSGLSSFAYLKLLPVDMLKIDQMFVNEIAYDRVSWAMVESINQVGHVMNLSTVAEGVENDETIRCLQEIGVDFIQGYGIHMPEPVIR